MTILPPPARPRDHRCQPPGIGVMLPKVCQHGTLWECPDCGRWWKCHLDLVALLTDWCPVRWYEVAARRRIAAHETEKMHYRVPTAVGTIHWWNCHPNPRRGQP